MQLNLELSPAQAEFLSDTATPNLLLCGGYGSGKSYAGALKAITLSLQQPGTTGIIASPNYGLAKRSIVPILEGLLRDQLQLKYTLHKSDLIFTIPFQGQSSQIHVLSVESYEKLVGINASYFVFDEMDICKAEHAREAWMKLSARVRIGNILQKCATTTPEGYRFAWEFWKRDLDERPELASQRKLIKAPTHHSRFVKDEYIQQLLAMYPPDLARAYLNGDFVNLQQGSVYCHFDRDANNTDWTIDDLPTNRPLLVGMDFNYAGMSAIVMGVFGDPTKVDVYGRQQANGEAKFVVLDELIGAQNTVEIIKDLKARYPSRRLIVCPDASGVQNRSSAAGKTDLSLLQDAGFELKYAGNNPKVRDRVNSVNALFVNGHKQRRLLVNTKKAPLLTRCLEQQTYDGHGAPVKDKAISEEVRTKIDGPVDALGYGIWQYAPLLQRATMTVS